MESRTESPLGSSIHRISFYVNLPPKFQITKGRGSSPSRKESKNLRDTKSQKNQTTRKIFKSESQGAINHSKSRMRCNMNSHIHLEGLQSLKL